MMEPVLQLENVTKTFPNFTLDRVSLSLESGYIMGLIGPNGSGKTTLLRLIMGLLSPERGKISVFGRDPQKNGPSIRQAVGFVYDQNPFHGELSTREMTRLIAPLYVDWDWDIYRHYSAEFNLPPKQKIKTLSKGTKLRYALAVALSHKARLLVFDEPTAGLDPVLRREFLQLLREVISEGSCSVLLASHIVSDLEHIADYVTLLAEGRVLFSRPQEDLLRHYALLKGNRRLLGQVSPKYLVGKPREYQFGFEGLVSHREEVAELIGDGAVLTTPGLEDIMYFYLGGRRGD